MEGEVMANSNFDVTIYLVPKLTTQQAAGAGSTGNKKRRFSSCDSVDSPEGGGHGPALAIVKARSSKLRECSAYFEACMSERWAQPKATFKTKFCLEAQAEVRHYVDCFSRMQFLCKPIASVADCIELLKVALQIGFQAVVDIGVKYLAAAPWDDDDEEQQVREFCTSPHLVPCNSLADLLVRLEDLPSGVEAKQQKLSLCAMNLLSCYLRDAISYESSTLNPERYGKFAESFHLIVSGSVSGAVCEKVVEHAMALITQESARLLSYLKKESSDGRFASTGVRNAVSSFCWLFKVARHCNVAQAVVEFLVNDVDALCVLYDGFKSNPTRQMGAHGVQNLRGRAGGEAVSDDRAARDAVPAGAVAAVRQVSGSGRNTSCSVRDQVHHHSAVAAAGGMLEGHSSPQRRRLRRPLPGDPRHVDRPSGRQEDASAT